MRQREHAEHRAEQPQPPAAEGQPGQRQRAGAELQRHGSYRHAEHRRQQHEVGEREALEGEQLGERPDFEPLLGGRHPLDAEQDTDRQGGEEGHCGRTEIQATDALVVGGADPVSDARERTRRRRDAARMGIDGAHKRRTRFRTGARRAEPNWRSCGPDTNRGGTAVRKSSARVAHENIDGERGEQQGDVADRVAEHPHRPGRCGAAPEVDRAPQEQRPQHDGR